MSVARLPFLAQFGKSTDPIFEQIIPGIWTFAEMATAVIAACIPSLRPLGDKWKWFPKFFVFDDDKEVGRTSPAIIVMGGQREFFGIRDGKIVSVRTLGSRLSVDFEVGRWSDEWSEVEMDDSKNRGHGEGWI